MKQNLRVSFGAVLLALATIAAMIFAFLNFEQRSRFEYPDDGVAWWDTDHGVEARYLSQNSPADRAGIRPGDRILEINGQAVPNQKRVAERLG